MASGYAYADVRAPGCGEGFPEGAVGRRGAWDGRSPDPSLGMFRRAFKYAVERGLSPEFMPELRSENGVLHAYRQDGSKIRLDHCPGWEDRTGYASLVEELRALQESSSGPWKRVLRPLG